jgi:threonine synthase
MILYSTRSNRHTASSTQAVLKGIAPDGGLYTPISLSELKVDVGSLLNMSAVEISAEVVGKLLDDYSREEMRALMEAAYANEANIRSAVADMVPTYHPAGDKPRPFPAEAEASPARETVSARA